jgi:hypothetical protein
VKPFVMTEARLDARRRGGKRSSATRKGDRDWSATMRARRKPKPRSRTLAAILADAEPVIVALPVVDAAIISAWLRDHPEAWQGAVFVTPDKVEVVRERMKNKAPAPRVIPKSASLERFLEALNLRNVARLSPVRRSHFTT